MNSLPLRQTAPVRAAAHAARATRCAGRILCLLAMLVGSVAAPAAFLVAAPGEAAAQPAPPTGAPNAGAAGAAERPGLGDTPESLQKNSGGVVFMFWLVALALVSGALFVITRRNLITAVMGMVGTFFAIAVVYAMLYAHFLAAIQVLVYAGAIMVLFVFVIMILNKPEAEPWSATGLASKIVVIGVLVYLLSRLVIILAGVEPPTGAGIAPVSPGEEIDSADWGSTERVGESLFTTYLFPFEAVSVVLLIAVVGAVAVARPHERRPQALAGDAAQTEGAAEGSAK